MGEFGIGQPVRRFEDKRLLSGNGRFQNDNNLLGQAYAYVLRSPHAHARIRALDLTTAKAAPGVVLFMTGDDLVEAKLGVMGVPFQRKRPDGSPMFARAHLGLARGAVRYVGEPVAFVVAETLAQAKDAAELIDIDYEALPSVTDTAEAAEGKIAVWDECPDNISNLFETGNKAATEAAFAKAAHIVKRRYVISRVYAHFMEPRGAIGVWDPGEGPFHPLRRCAVPASGAPGARHSYIQNPGEQDPGDRRRCRRRVRHEGLAISRASAGAARGEEIAPAGQMDV
jgi:carbon-monoxide dehydrogenase large subunit